ncbi:hypothetical protein KDK_72580 [Dictyobacter kobayashii]|uniref:Amidohydrolase-related domain-containing protein n=2 Tax=Dictyobacter kobayashii TaxID=2014872 RepID=A0A402AWK8_9CHLR|nr:hypothetical protein KDK_72580 [Dictyobacter kobayashii]
MIGVAALIFAGLAEQEYTRDDGWKGSAPGAARKNLYIDTMGFDLSTLRFALDLLGPEHLIIGSDWPIMPITTRRRVDEILLHLNLTEAQKAAVLSGNTERLLTPITD